MPTIDPSPTAEELRNLAAIFATVEASLQKYLTSAAGQNDPDFNALTAIALSLNNAADTIAVMQLQLATEAGLSAVAVINKATAELQKALVLRQTVTRTLSILQAIVAFGGAIASDDVGSIISSGDSLYQALTTNSQGGQSGAGGSGDASPAPASGTGATAATGR